MGNSRDSLTSYDAREIHTIMRRIGGWTYGGRKRSKNYGQQRTYVRIESAPTVEDSKGDIDDLF